MDHGIPGGGSCEFYGDSLTRAQQNFVIRIPQSDGSTQYVWTGDMWQSAADGIKVRARELVDAWVGCVELVTGSGDMGQWLVNVGTGCCGDRR